MSIQALSGLRDYLYSTLSPQGMIWLGEQLTEHGHRQGKPLKPYTKEELVARIEESERQFADGRWHDFDEAMGEIEQQLEEEEQLMELRAAV